jgi:nickel/cobalt exporter
MLKLPQKLLLACILILGFISTALAQSSLGIGANESQIVVQGPFANLWATINTYQQQFYRALTTALREISCRRPWSRKSSDFFIYDRQ